MNATNQSNIICTRLSDKKIVKYLTKIPKPNFVKGQKISGASFLGFYSPKKATFFKKTKPLYPIFIWDWDLKAATHLVLNPFDPRTSGPPYPVPMDK